MLLAPALPETFAMLLCRGLATCTPSLADLCRAVLGRELRQPQSPHYCGDDAAAAMEVARYLLDGGPMCIEPPILQVQHCMQWQVGGEYSQSLHSCEMSHFSATTGAALTPTTLGSRTRAPLFAHLLPLLPIPGLQSLIAPWVSPWWTTYVFSVS